MRHSVAIAAAILSCALASPVVAQNIPPVPHGPTVAPAPPPPQPTPSPLSPNSSNVSKSRNSQPKLDTFGDKTARCLHYGATQGLTGGDLAAYSRACANN